MQGRRGAFVGGATAVGLVLAGTCAGCGVSPRRTLDGGSVARQIRAEVVRQYDIPASRVTVTCPGGVTEAPGQSFTCQAALDGQTLQIYGTVTSRDGHYRTRPDSAVIEVGSVAGQIQSRIAAQVHAATRLSCGTRAVLVVRVGTTFSCTSTALGQNRRVTVTVDDLQGHVHFSVAPPTTPRQP